MRTVILGKTGIAAPQNGFGALPIQRDDMPTAVRILRRAYEGGMRFFDTARAYSDSEQKLGLALSDVRKSIFIATKTGAKTPDELHSQLEISLKNLKTDYLDLYQFHCAGQVYAPGDGTGMYEAMLALRRAGVVRHIGITAHKIDVAEEAVKSGLYETLQFPFSYLATDRERALVALCAEHNVGFIAMKGLAGGLISNSRAAYAYIGQFDNVMPIWGIQRESELDEWLFYMDCTPTMDSEFAAFIEKERLELSGDFCRSCGYCMPCPQGIQINQCARMSLMLRRAPTAAWTTEYWRAEMEKIDTCLGCGRCKSRCPYELDTPELLKRNLEDYRNVLAGRTVLAK